MYAVLEVSIARWQDSQALFISKDIIMLPGNEDHREAILIWNPLEIKVA
jgi:hypothetical protein